ncbi:MAG: ABC transporter permease [Clostridia bacterium]|nr:ABC transporter permease [Clostridia bacterium]
MTNEKTIREPLFHISKRAPLSKGQVALIYLSAVVIALILSGFVCTLLFGANPFAALVGIFEGNFGTDSRIWWLLRDASLLLLVSLALAPAFRMKFWNLGGNGQIIMGALACYACMHYAYGQIPNVIMYILMITTSVGVGILWAIIPAVFKAKWNTNETLFTLMMNYIAMGLVNYATSKWSLQQTGKLEPINGAKLPEIGNKYILIILIAVAVTVFMFFYLKKSKHGFEVALVGESVNTARYVGINVKKTVIRTVLLSGAICGIVGLLFCGVVDGNVYEDTPQNMGFTAIMAVWFAQCNPLIMIISSFGIIFLSRGINHYQKNVLKLTNSAVSDMIVGFVYFIILCCEFFVVYKLQTRRNKRNFGFKDISEQIAGKGDGKPTAVEKEERNEGGNK